ncbi:ABC transporter substrate binding protein [Thauera chlorobenzoica]|nr:ABC transporter substrate binding protein [Thauera chlorobenzoica]
MKPAGYGSEGGPRQRAFRCMLVASLLLAVVLGSPPAAALEIALLLSAQKGPEQQFAEAFHAALKPGMHRVVHAGAVPEDVRPEVVGAADLVLAAGAGAAEAALRETDRPILMVLAGLREVRRLQAAYPNRRLGAIVLDQPPERHLRLVRAILPQEARVAVLVGPESRFFAPALTRAAGDEGFVVEFAEVADPKELVSVLQPVLDKAGALLPLPDSLVSSPGAARTILLTSYRYRRPIFAFSSAYVTAGALAAIFSTPEQVAGDVAELLNAKSAATQGLDPLLGEIRYPERYDIAVNRMVARALGIAVPGEQALREQVAGGGRAR